MLYWHSFLEKYVYESDSLFLVLGTELEKSRTYLVKYYNINAEVK